MTRDEILKMAEEAGGIQWGWESVEDASPMFERFAALATAKEREACAVLAEALGVQWWDLRKEAGGENIRRHLHSKVHGAEEVAAAIRARGQKEGA